MAVRTPHEVALGRLSQLVQEVHSASLLDFYDRLREVKSYCESTPSLSTCLTHLPNSHYDFDVDWRAMESQWPQGEEGIACRWDAISQIVDQGPGGVRRAWGQLMTKRQDEALSQIVGLFLIPVYNYLVSQLESSDAKLYMLLRYKRWVEWFEAEQTRKVYETNGEEGLNRHLRRFLFESGIDYPFPDPPSARGKADIVAELETDDPLVLEAKVWDSKRGYGRDRIRGGLRQVIGYADDYGKNKGYVPVFNLDTEPLMFVGSEEGVWPARIERGGKLYFFLSIDIAKQQEPISKRDKGQPIKANEVQLEELWDSLDNA